MRRSGLAVQPVSFGGAGRAFWSSDWVGHEAAQWQPSTLGCLGSVGYDDEVLQMGGSDLR